MKKLVKFKTRIMITPADDQRLDAYVPLTKLRKATIYKLKIIPEDLDSEYTVFIRGERKADTFLGKYLYRQGNVAALSIDYKLRGICLEFIPSLGIENKTSAELRDKSAL